MSEFYAEMATTVSEILEEFGQTVTLRKYATPDYDPATSAAVVDYDWQAYKDYSRKGALDKVSLIRKASSLVVEGEKFLLMEAGVVPEMQDHIVTANGDEFSIIAIDEINPANSPVAYELKLKAV